MSPDIAVLANGVASLAMAGIIWFVQLVHYPLFAFADRRDFWRFADAHQRRTTWVVAPLMLAELAAATWLLIPASGVPRTLALVGWLLVLFIWLITGLVQVPLHRRLAQGFDEALARRLVRSNWLRTAAWTARAIVAIVLLAPARPDGGPEIVP